MLNKNPLLGGQSPKRGVIKVPSINCFKGKFQKVHDFDQKSISFRI